MDVFKEGLCLSWRTNVKALSSNDKKTELWKSATQSTRKQYAHMLGVPNRKRASLARCESSSDICEWMDKNMPPVDYKEHATLRIFTDQLVKEAAHSDTPPATLSFLQRHFWSHGGYSDRTHTKID